MKYRVIEKWMLLLLVVLLTACGSDNKEEIVNPDEDCYLDIYVYAPDRPIVTRADVGNIAQRTAAESEIKSLQIWVFKHSDGNKVGYLGAGASDAEVPNLVYLNESGQQIYRMKVSKEFANSPQAVDVYVVANKANYVTKSDGTAMTLGPSTTRDQLDGAVIGTNYFGTTDLYDKDDLLTNGRIVTNGLPMSAVAKDQPISGSFPALRIGKETQMTILQLSRAVSKLRFVLCRIIEKPDAGKKLVSINEISLNENQIPTETYFMPGTYNYSSYVGDKVTYVDENHKLSPTDIPKVVDPFAYAYETQSAQDYEDLIDKAISGEQKANDGDENLKELGLTYFRESDKQLTGAIKYTYKEKNESGNYVDQQATATFSMAAPGDFLRNHSWIIYIFYLDEKIYILTVTHIGMKKWVTDTYEDSKTVYNW